MSIVSAVFEVMDWATREGCDDPRAATRFLLEEMEYQGISAETVAHQLNYCYWELLPVNEANEIVNDGATMLLIDEGLRGLALIA